MQNLQRRKSKKEEENPNRAAHEYMNGHNSLKHIQHHSGTETCM